MDICLVIYSHSDYDDVLKVQNDFIKDIPLKKILFTNNEPNKHNFDKVILYNDKLNYTKRTEQCLKQINTKYILFCHDIDVILQYNHFIISKLYDLIEKHNIDRLDLGYAYNNDKEETIDFDDKHRLIKNTNIKNYIYNVNPSIWKTSVFLNIMDKFDESYRNIENVAQEYTSQFNVYKISTNDIVHSGYYNITNLFVYLHITYHLRLLSLGKNNLDPELKEIYKKIRENYKFNRGENESRPGWDF
jgi:hypothetical protein